MVLDCFEEKKSKHSPADTELFCDPAPALHSKKHPILTIWFSRPHKRAVPLSTGAMSGPKKYHSTSLGVVILILVAGFQGKSVLLSDWLKFICQKL